MDQPTQANTTSFPTAFDNPLYRLPLVLPQSDHPTDTYRMALAKFNKAVAALVEETAMKTVDDVMVALKVKFDMDESDIQEFATEFKEQLKSQLKESISEPKRKRAKAGEKTEKKTRAPTAYNLFISEKMAEIKANDPSIKGKALMSAAIAVWKQQKVAKADADTVASGTEAETDE